MKKALVLIALLVTLSIPAQAQLITITAAGTLTFAIGLGTATAGTPFSETFTINSATPVNTNTSGPNLTSYVDTGATATGSLTLGTVTYNLSGESVADIFSSANYGFDFAPSANGMSADLKFNSTDSALAPNGNLSNLLNLNSLALTNNPNLTQSEIVVNGPSTIGDIIGATGTVTSVSVAVVPEPSTYALWILGLGAIAWKLRHRRNA